MTDARGDLAGPVPTGSTSDAPAEQSPEDQLVAAEFLVATRMREEARNRTARVLQAAHRMRR
jgi:hypothetical protein